MVVIATVLPNPTAGPSRGDTVRYVATGPGESGALPALENLAGVSIAKIDRLLKRLPIQHVDAVRGGLEQQVGQFPLPDGARLAIDHAGAPEDLHDVHAGLAYPAPRPQPPSGRHFRELDIGLEVPVGA